MILPKILRNVQVNGVSNTSLNTFGDLTHDYWVDHMYLDTDERRRSVKSANI